jgi:hypothetical protein
LFFATLLTAGAGVTSVRATTFDIDPLPNGLLLRCDPAGFNLSTGAEENCCDSDPNCCVNFRVAVATRDGHLVREPMVALDAARSAQMMSDGTMLIADTGNDRVLLVDSSDFLIWNSAAAPMSDNSLLDFPTYAELLPSGHVLITDSHNHRVVEVDEGDLVEWQFGATGVPGDGGQQLLAPQKATRLSNGNTLISDTGNDRVIEVNPAGELMHTIGHGELRRPASAQRMANGNTLVADSGNQRIVEFAPNGTIVREIATPGPVFDAEALPNGHVLAGGKAGAFEYDLAGNLLWRMDDIQATPAEPVRPASSLGGG